MVPAYGPNVLVHHLDQFIFSIVYERYVPQASPVLYCGPLTICVEHCKCVFSLCDVLTFYVCSAIVMCLLFVH